MKNDIKAPAMSKEDQARHHKYQAKDDLRTLMAAHEIHKDKARHARVKAHAKEQMQAIKSMTSAAQPADTATDPAASDTSGGY